jgi:tetratricopeptide (TPR) repeat protein
MSWFHIIIISIFACMAPITSIAQAGQTTDAPQLIESRELTARVVKLYGEHKYDEALPLAKRALELGEAALGKTDSRLIGPLVNLGDLYVATTHFDDAKSSFERALTLGETNFGPEDLHLIRPLDELGYLLSNKGDYTKAADLLSRSLSIKKKRLQPRDIEVARAARTLGDIYRRNREYAKAESLYQEAIQLYEEAGKKDAELVEVLNRYLTVLTAENKKDEAASIQAKLAGLSAEPGIVEGGVVNGRAVKLVQPSYPLSAPHTYGIRIIRVRVLIDENGKVISAKAEPSATPDMNYPRFAAAAEDAARKSLFTPTLKAGVPAKVNGTIVYQYITR